MIRDCCKTFCSSNASLWVIINEKELVPLTSSYPSAVKSPSDVFLRPVPLPFHNVTQTATTLDCWEMRKYFCRRSPNTLFMLRGLISRHRLAWLCVLCVENGLHKKINIWIKVTCRPARWQYCLHTQTHNTNMHMQPLTRRGFTAWTWQIWFFVTVRR